jgi:uncharacterized protein
MFIDEIQESPDAIQLLRYFYEDYPDLHVIAAGSLLEFAMKKVKSFPVGRVEFLYLHPLNFPEYLEATGQSAALEQIGIIPYASFAHPILLNLFNQFVITGGMPEVIAEYTKKQSLTELPAIYESLWETYRNDVEKYVSNETERKVIKHIMAIAHLYIDQRVKFQNFGQSNYRSREVGEAFRNLDDAKVIQLLYPTTDVEIPAKPDLRKSPRLQFLDTGLINHALGIQGELLALNDLSRAWKGTIIPHIIAQEIISLNLQSYRKPLFWVREKKQSSAEVDLVIPFHDKVIPVEIKSGSEGTLRSLHQFVEATNHPYAVRMYAGEFKVSKTKTPGGKTWLLMNLPYYLGTKINGYLEYFLSSYKLGFESGGHPWGPEDTITLRLEEPYHPVNRAFAGKGFQASDEVFQFTHPYTRDKLRILLGIDTDLTDMSEKRRILPERRADLDIAISWVRRYGRGKVFYTSFGHNAHLSWNPGVMGHYFDGIRFAANLLEAPYIPSGRLTPALQAQEKLGWRFGIEAYTFRNNTFFETIDRTRELGLQYVGGLNVQKVSDGIPKDFDYNLSDEELLEIRQKLADAGISMLTYYIFDIPGDRETVSRIFEFGRKMGIETFISEPAIENLDIIEEFCEKYNIKLAIHNHGEWLSPVYMHPAKIVELTRGRSPLIGAACDFGHWAKEGIDPLEAIKTLGHRVITLQMHDQSAMNTKGHDVPWGTGVIDLEGILRYMQQKNIRPVMFGLEYSYNWDHSLPEIKESIEYFNRVSLELAGGGD